MTASRFRKTIWAYYKKHKRDMPWRRTRDPYRIAVSEIMLQQTQVARVLKFYPTFVKQFPDFHALAQARTSDVLRVWQGLGYNRRALSLQNLSRIVLEKFNGTLPQSSEELIALPGIGKATAGSIRAFAWNERDVFIETNIRRVFIHFFFPRRKKVTDVELERYIKRTLPAKNSREWYWALMDYGAMLSKSESRVENPNRRSVHYTKQSKFTGSDRELRGKLLRTWLTKKRINITALSGRYRKIALALVREGFADKKGRIS